MAKQTRLIWVFLIMFSICGVLLLSALNTQSQYEKQKPSQPLQAKDVDTSSFPVVDYLATPLPHGEQRAKHEARGRKYKRKHSPKLEYTDSIHVVNHSLPNLSALPVDKSSLIIVGEVADAKAYLSEDKTTVYSEFNVTVESVLKNDSTQELQPRSSLVVERYGGKVRLPSGKIVVASIDYEGMPRVRGKYLFFLTNQQDETFPIVTGYELRNGQVFPLDETLPNHPIHAYKGRDAATLLSDLMSVLETSRSGARRN